MIFTSALKSETERLTVSLTKEQESLGRAEKSLFESRNDLSTQVGLIRAIVSQGKEKNKFEKKSQLHVTCLNFWIGS